MVIIIGVQADSRSIPVVDLDAKADRIQTP